MTKVSVGIMGAGSIGCDVGGARLVRRGAVLREAKRAGTPNLSAEELAAQLGL